MSGFYILYDHSVDQFNIESVNEVYRSLLQKYGPEKLPKLIVSILPTVDAAVRSL
jgi:hypothetical protein